MHAASAQESASGNGASTVRLLEIQSLGTHPVLCKEEEGSWSLETVVVRAHKKVEVELYPILVRKFGVAMAERKEKNLLRKCSATVTRPRRPSPTPTRTTTAHATSTSIRAATPTAAPTSTPTSAPTPTPTNAPTATPILPDLGINTNFHGLVPFPANNPWNTDISGEPVDPNSDNLIASMGATTGLHPDFGEDPDNGIPYIVVPGTQPKVPVTFGYESESDPGPYPIPTNVPIEGGVNSTGDRHTCIIDRDNWILYEMWEPYFLNGAWSAGSGAIFNLNSNAVRPAGWTSADAAGLPIFPGLVRYDEVAELGEINHALRFTVINTRTAYVPPARHEAGISDDPNLPPMGMRVRLKASVDISSYSPHLQVIFRALKKYGMFVADNGGPWYISGAPDTRWSDDELHQMDGITGSDFEVVQMEGLVEGN